MSSDRRNDNIVSLPANIRPVGYYPMPAGYTQNNGTQTVDQQVGDGSPSFEDLLPILRKRRRIIIGATLGCFLLAFLYCTFTTKLYTATAALEIRGYSPVLAGLSAESLYGTDTRKVDYQKTTIAKLRRPGIADRVLVRDGLADSVTEYFATRGSLLGNAVKFGKGIVSSVSDVFFGADSDADSTDSPAVEGQHYIHRTKFIQSYLGLIDVDQVPETALVEVSATTASPKLSQRIANTHAEGFMEEIRQERQDTVMSNMRLLQIQADELKSRLATAETELGKYAEKNELLSLSSKSDDSDVFMKQIVRMNEVLGDATSRRIASESLLKEVQGKSPAEASAIDDESVRTLRSTLYQVEAETAQLAEKVTPEYPEMRELSARAESLRRAITQERTRLLKTIKFQYDSNLGTEKKLMEQLEKEKLKVNDVSKRMVQYNMLRKEADSLRDLYQTILKQIQEAQVSGSSNGTSVFVSEFAPLPSKPSAPKTGLTLIASLFLGLIVGIGAALVLEVMNSHVVTPEEASAAFGLPLLGFIPAFSNDSTTDDKQLKLLRLPDFVTRMKSGRNGASEENRTVNLPTKSVSEAANEVSKIITISSPHAVVSEALRTIRAGILLSSADEPPKVIMVTSAEKGEGKTVLSSNLAVTLAQASNKVLIIDGDLRQRRAGKMFNVPLGSRGLSDVLVGHANISDVVIPSEVQNLSIMPAGSRPPNPAELVGSKRMGELIQALREEYDFIILDTPPVLPVSDSLHLSRVADSVVITVRSNKTEKGAVHEARRRLVRVNARILGIVLNDFDLDKFGVASSSTRTYYGDDDEPVASAG